MRIATLSAVLLATNVLLAQNALANLIVDGDFDAPVETTGGLNTGFKPYGVGATFGGPGNSAWTVVQSDTIAASIAVTNTLQYTTTGFGKTYYTSEGGPQLVNLNSRANGAKTGIQQTVATTIGTTYLYTFHIGYFVDDADGAQFRYVMGNQKDFSITQDFGPFTPDPVNGDGVAGIQWIKNSVLFTANEANTTFAFYNDGPIGQTVFVDSVSLDVNPGELPEPGGLTLAIGAGLAGLLSMRRGTTRRSRR